MPKATSKPAPDAQKAPTAPIPRELPQPAAQAPLSVYMPFETRCAKVIRVNFTGDVYLDAERTAPTAAVFDGVRPLLAWAHFNVVNLEGVVTPSTERAFPDFPFALRIHAAVPSLLVSQGIRHVTRANNHSMDYGLHGMRDTDAALRKAGIAWTGVGENVSAALAPLILENDDIRVGILAFTTTYPDGAWASDTKAGVPFPVESRLRSAIERVRPQVDYLVTTFHWGEERTPELKPHQPALARIALGAGADAVIGHHAHVAQAIERVEGKWVLYGLGNFLFHSGSPWARLGLLASLELCRPPTAEPTKAPAPLEPRLALVPLDTFNSRTGFVTRPYTREAFLKEASSHFKKTLFPPDAPFVTPATDGSWVAK